MIILVIFLEEILHNVQSAGSRSKISKKTKDFKKTRQIAGAISGYIFAASTNVCIAVTIVIWKTFGLVRSAGPVFTDLPRKIILVIRVYWIFTMRIRAY